MEISEKEFAVINEISNNHLPDQRELANRTGISLGLINLIIKRLIKKGYIKAKQLNHKKIQYLLTPKGFGEKAQKSYSFTMKTIEHVKVIKQKIQELILSEDKNGAELFTIIGNGELADMVEMYLKNLEGKTIAYIKKRAEAGSDHEATRLGISYKNAEQNKVIDIIQYLSSEGILYYEV